MRPTRLGHRHRSDEYEGEARRARGRSRGVAGEDAPAFVVTGACDTRNASAPAAVWCEYLTDPRPQPGIGEVFGPGIATRVASLERGAVIVELGSCRHIPSEDTDFSPRAGFSSPNPEWRTTRVTTRRSIPGSRSSGAAARAILPLSNRGAAPQVTGSQCFPTIRRTTCAPSVNVWYCLWGVGSASRAAPSSSPMDARERRRRARPWRRGCRPRTLVPPQGRALRSR